MTPAEKTSEERDAETARPDARPLVVLENVNKHFGDLHVLRDIDLTIHEREVVVVIGPSGSGKSTLCRTINRLEPIDSGTIALDGEPLPVEGKALARLRSDVGMVFQSFNLFAHRTVSQNVTLGLIIAYEELARAGRQIYVFYNNPLAVGLLIAAIYVVINATLSRLAVALEARQRRRVSAG